MRAALWFALTGVSAWDADGHGAIGMTCMSGIKASALTQLKRLLGGKDIVDISPWSFQLVHKYPEMESIFYQMQERNLSEGIVNCDFFDPGASCTDGHCILKALTYYFDLLMSGSSEVAYKAPVNLKLSDSDLIRLIVSLIGELHSVSRFGYTATHSGRDVPVSYIDGSQKIDTNIYDYWDHNLVQKTIRDRPHFWFSGWTHMNNLSRQIITHEEQFWKNTENKTAVFESWAMGTFKDSCSRAFRIRTKQPQYARLQLQVRTKADSGIDPDTSPILPKDLIGGDTELHLAHPANYIIPTNHLFADFDLIKHKILVAGLRLSLVVNHILTHKDAKKLRVGSAVLLKDRKSSLKPNAALGPISSNSGMWANQPSAERQLVNSWTTNLVINMGIIAVLLLGFLAFLNFTGERNNCHKVDTKAKE